MGKKENIKRAKRLKALKKQREEENNETSEKISNINQLKADLQKEGIKTYQNNGPIKYSDLLMDFLSPVLTHDLNYEEMKSLIQMGICSWNLAVMKDASPETYKKMVNTTEELKNANRDEMEILETFIERKLSDYSDFRFIYHSFSLKESDKKFHLAVSVNNISV